MRAVTNLLVVLLLLATQNGFGENVLFEDAFTRGLSDKWQLVGLKETDYRVRQSGLELRVQPGKPTRNTPMLKVLLPFTSADDVVVSVKVTVLDEFTQDHEFAGVYLLGESGLEFGAKKERVDGKLVFAPGNYEFKPGEEGDPRKYKVKCTAATQEAGPLQIVVRSGNAFFQVGPSADKKYLNFFHSAILDGRTGFCLIAAGAPDGASHWVRFENFRVVKQ
jgi:hypothetical protein